MEKLTTVQRDILGTISRAPFGFLYASDIAGVCCSSDRQVASRELRKLCALGYLFEGGRDKKGIRWSLV